MVCNFGWSLSRGHSHTLSLFRMFAGAAVEWVFGRMNNHQAAKGDQDLSGTGMIHYQNGIQGFLNHGGWLNIDFVGSDGWISARNEHADFEMWSRHPQTREPIRRQFPNPKRPKSSQQAAVEGLVQNLKDGSQPLCPGEFGRESLETAIELRESHRRGGEQSRATAGRPNSSHQWTRLRIGSDTSLLTLTEGLELIAVNKHKISSPIRQKCVLPSVYVSESDPHRGY